MKTINTNTHAAREIRRYLCDVAAYADRDSFKMLRRIVAFMGRKDCFLFVGGLCQSMAGVAAYADHVTHVRLRAMITALRDAAESETAKGVS